MRVVVPEFLINSSINTGVLRAYENLVRESGKDSLAVRDASAGRVALVLLDCAWAGASAGAYLSSLVQNACSEPGSHRSSAPLGRNQMARSTSGHDLGVWR